MEVSCRTTTYLPEYGKLGNRRSGTNATSVEAWVSRLELLKYRNPGIPYIHQVRRLNGMLALTLRPMYRNYIRSDRTYNLAAYQLSEEPL